MSTDSTGIQTNVNNLCLGEFMNVNFPSFVINYKASKT